MSFLSDLGMTWLLTTPEVEKMPLAFVREAKGEVAAMLALKPRLENFVAVNYASAIKLLKLLGFKLDEPVPLGKSGELFSRFHLGF